MNNTLIGFQEATGKIDYTFTNDYMFRAILQTNELVLRGLISALLHIPLEEISSVHIENQIALGETLKSKDFILDIHVSLNNNTLINLEMQVENRHNWTDRSLSYLCRSFDQLYKSQDYETALPAIHIGILNFTLFPDVPEFYASHKLMNIKNHHVFNDKFTLNVLSLKQIHLATEEDKAWQIDVWAKLFAAKTWRDIKMIAKNNEILTSATESLFKLNADDIIREQCRAREEAERHERTVQRDLAAQAKTIAEQAETIKSQEETIKELKSNNDVLTSKYDKLQSSHGELQSGYNELQSSYNELQSGYDELKSIVTSLQKQLADKTDL